MKGVKKQNLPSKICPVCQREFSLRTPIAIGVGKELGACKILQRCLQK